MTKPDGESPFPSSNPFGGSMDDKPGDGASLIDTGPYERPLAEGETRVYVPEPPRPPHIERN